MNNGARLPSFGAPVAADAFNEKIRLPRRGSDSTGLSRNDAGRINDILSKLEVENKIKEGAENLLQVFDERKLKEGKEAYKRQVESQLDAANAKIQLLQSQLNEYGLNDDNIDEAKAATSAVAAIEEDQNTDDDLESGQESPTWSLGDILQSIENMSQPSDFLIARANNLVSLLQRHPLLKYDLVMSEVGDRIRTLLLHKQTEVVAAGYRVARYAFTDLDSLNKIRSLQTDLLVMRTLTKDSKSQLERIQALKLVRSFLDIPGGANEITIGVIRALVAVAEQSDDKLRNIACETLAEIFIQHPEKASKGGAIRVLFQCIVEGPYELSLPMTQAVVYVLESPANRHLFRNGRDLEFLLSAFADFQVRGHVHTERLQNSARVLSSMLRTWGGLVALSVDDFSAIKVLIQCLCVPVPALREVLLDLLFTILRIKLPSWSSSFLAGRRLTTYGRVPDEQLDSSTASSYEEKCRFVDHFTALLLQILVHCGLLEMLVELMETSDNRQITRKATLLMSEILALTERFFPHEEIKRIALMPALFNSATRHKTSDNVMASGAVFQIDKISRSLHKVQRNPDEMGESQKQLRSTQVKLKMGVQIDDPSFKQLLLDTNVLSTKTFTKWNWDALNELIQGPLRNPRRLEEAIKTTKFMKRLMSFYRPFKFRFASVKKTKPNQKYVEVGKALMRTLLYNPEGVKYLTENKLLRQIAECLAQLDPTSGITSPEPLFSSHRLQNTLSYGYLSLLGTLSGDPNGMLMLERWRMFNMIYHISDVGSREALLKLFIESMNYQLQGHPRIILSKALTTSGTDIRHFATRHLRTLMKADGETQKWAVGLLVTQLYDPEMEVCRLAVEVLEGFCDRPENLEHFIKLQPSLDHLGDIGTPLLLRFLSTSSGFQYLKELDYVHKEMDNWFHGQNDNYVSQIEEYLESIQTSWIPLPPGAEATLTAGMKSIPRHFYGELALTEEGCQLLQAKGHFKTFADYIHKHKNEKEEKEIITKVKGALWAVGNIGSNPLGAPFLEDCAVVGDIVEIAHNSDICSLKGTAFFAMGLISSTPEGGEILDEYGWDNAFGVMGDPRGVCLPVKLSSMFHTKSSTQLATKWTLLANGDASKKPTDSTTEDEEVEFPKLSDEKDAVKQEILSKLSDLSNQILANDASRHLVKLEARHSSYFQSIDVFSEAMHMLEQYRYKLPVRRFIFELFDTNDLIERLSYQSKDLKRRRHDTR